MGRTPTLALLAVTAAVAIHAAPARAADGDLPLRPLGESGTVGDERLSNERTVTRYGHPNWRAPVYQYARYGTKKLAKLRFVTEDGPPEVYLVLRGHVDGAGRTWLKIRIPGRPNGRTGWVRREALGELIAVRTYLRVNRTTLRATLYRDGKKVWSSRVGVGKASTPTPAGSFWIRERLRNLGGGGVYGPWAFGTAAYSVLSDWPGGGVIGIHGTDEPQLIPGRPSHGCIRVPNAAVRRLARLMPVGTPVQIV